MALKTIWLCAEQPCGERLKGMLCEWMKHYPQPLSERTREQLGGISASQIDRLLAPHRAHNPKRLYGTRAGTLLKHQIPIKTEHWEVSKPGYVEIDTVAHCGESMQGDFIWSLVLTDICTGWTATRAVWNKGSHGILHSLEQMEQELPFELLGVDSDNSSEFLNYHLYGYLKQKYIAFTRSRPYRKNDNAHVEQKNWTHARQLLGYQRMDNPEQVQTEAAPFNRARVY